MFTSFFLTMLNREAASPARQPERIVESLQIREGSSIADLGSGGGYFTLKFARKVGRAGTVYAIDTQQNYLDFIRRRAEQEGLENITFVLGTEEGIAEPEAAVDLIFARNMFHHINDPAKYFHHLTRFLKLGGKVAIIDHKPKGGFSFVSLFKHHTSEEIILQEMEKAGYFKLKSFDFLPKQTFIIFGVK